MFKVAPVSPIQWRVPTQVTASLLATGITLSALLAGCAPPSKSGSKGLSGGEGRAIIAVKPNPRGAYQTVEIDGKEYLQARGEIGKPGGKLMDLQIGEGPKTFNGWASNDATSGSLSELMIAGLVSTDAYTGEVYPYLAKSVELKPDKMTYLVKLRKGLTWSDGKPLTADDVVFTWGTIVKQGLGNASNRDVNLIDGKFPEVKKVDDLTIEFKTAAPFAPFKRNLGQGIAPKHIFEPVIKKGGDKAFQETWGTTDALYHPEKFVSSGMWQLESYNQSEKRIIMKRNPHFFMVDKAKTQLPYLEKYVLSFVGDLNNLHLQFEQGKADTYGIPGDKLTLARKLKKPSFQIYNLGPNTGTTFLTFNLNNRKDAKTGKPYVNPIQSSWFTNTNFRQAVDWAINRQSIVDNIIKGVGAPLFTAESLSSIYLNKSLANGHPQDIEKAKSLLKEAGFSWDSTGQLIDSKKNKVEFTLFTNAGNDTREAIGVSLKEDLSKLGMKVNFKPIDFNVLVGKLGDSSWDAVVMGLTGGPLEPNGGANVWKSDSALHMFNQRTPDKNGIIDISDRFPWEKELDDLFNEGVHYFEFSDRKKIYDRYQQIAYEQQPFIYLYSPLTMIGVRKRLQNVDPTPLGGIYHNLEEIWIDESKEK